MASSLTRIQGALEQDQYRIILNEQLIPIGTQYYDGIQNRIFQQDNCSPHKAKSVRSLLDAKGIKLMSWSAKSPDLNPIKNAWALLKNKLRRRHTYTSFADELFNV